MNDNPHDHYDPAFGVGVTPKVYYEPAPKMVKSHDHDVIHAGQLFKGKLRSNCGKKVHLLIQKKGTKPTCKKCMECLTPAVYYRLFGQEQPPTEKSAYRRYNNRSKMNIWHVSHKGISYLYQTQSPTKAAIFHSEEHQLDVDDFLSVIISDDDGNAIYVLNFKVRQCCPSWNAETLIDYKMKFLGEK